MQTNIFSSKLNICWYFFR